MKKQVLRYMYHDCSNVHYNQTAYSIPIAIGKLFPEETTVFEYLKRNNYKDLPQVLQTTERKLFLDTICKKINKENRTIPLFTIHDSIATTEPYVDFVEQVMMAELKAAIGYPPTLHREY